MKITKHYFCACRKKEDATGTRSHFKRMRLEGESSEDTGHDGTEASSVAASAVENRGGGRRRSRGGAAGDGAGGETDGADGGAGGGSDGGDTGGGDLGGGGGSSSGGLSLGADCGGDLDALDDGGGGGSGGSRGGLSGASLGSGGGAGAGASGGGETELGGVLVLAGTLDNEEETVVGDVGLEVGAGGPLELSAVGDGLSESLEGNDVGGGTAQEDQGDGTSGGGGPLDGVGLALGNDLVQAGRGDGIAGRVLGVVRSSVGSRQTHEGGENGGDGETHGDLVSRLTKSD